MLLLLLLQKMLVQQLLACCRVRGAAGGSRGGSGVGGGGVRHDQLRGLEDGLEFEEDRQIELEQLHQLLEALEANVGEPRKQRRELGGREVQQRHEERQVALLQQRVDGEQRGGQHLLGSALHDETQLLDVLARLLAHEGLLQTREEGQPLRQRARRLVVVEVEQLLVRHGREKLAQLVEGHQQPQVHGVVWRIGTDLEQLVSRDRAAEP